MSDDGYLKIVQIYKKRNFLKILKKTVDSQSL